MHRLTPAIASFVIKCPPPGKNLAPVKTPHWPLFYSLPTPVLAHPPNTTMPADRQVSTIHSHPSGHPYVRQIIVISDDEEEPAPVVTRGSPEARRPNEDLNITLKVEVPKLDGLR